jgi:hypothetical protein
MQNYLLNRHPGVIVELMEDYRQRLAINPEIGFLPVLQEHAMYIKNMDFDLYKEMVHTGLPEFERLYASLVESSNYKRRILDNE